MLFSEVLQLKIVIVFKEEYWMGIAISLYSVLISVLEKEKKKNCGCRQASLAPTLSHYAAMLLKHV